MSLTKDRILDTAQRLIGEQGYAATSVRHIVTEAGVNLAAIHYHFGSKEELLDSVIARRAGPVNEERLVLLHGLPQSPTVRQILEAFLLPMSRADRDPGFVRLMGRMMAEGLLISIVRKHFHGVLGEFIQVLRRTLPDLPEQEFRWRTQFMFGALAYTMMFNPQNDVLGIGDDPGDIRSRLEKLVTFLAAGFEAPTTSGAGLQACQEQKI